MIIYMVTSTERNYTLIPQTNAAIICATQELLGDIHHITIGRDTQKDQNFLRQLVQHNQRGEEYLIFDVTGKNTFKIDNQKFIRSRFSYISDAPYTIWPYIEDMEARSIITYSNRGDAEFLSDMGFRKPSFFMPHGGPNPDRGMIDFKDRDIDILVIGRIEKETSLLEIAAKIEDMSIDWAGLLRDAANRTIEDLIQPYNALKMVAHEKGFSLFDILPKQKLLDLLAGFYTHIEEVNRNKLLSSMKNLRLDIVGPVRSEIAGICDANHRFHGPKFGDECIEMMKRAKVVLNSVSVFPEGSHERIWFGMAHGAAVFTDQSHYVAETFQHDENILFIDNNDHKSSVENLHHALETDGKLEAMANSATVIYPQHHTWEQRLAQGLSKVGDIIALNDFEGGVL